MRSANRQPLAGVLGDDAEHQGYHASQVYCAVQSHLPTAGPYDEPMPVSGSFTSYCALEPSSPKLPRHMGTNRLEMTHHSADSLPVEMPQYHPHMLTFPVRKSPSRTLPWHQAGR